MHFPSMFRVAQRFDSPRIENIPEAVDRELARLNLADKVRPGRPSPSPPAAAESPISPSSCGPSCGICKASGLEPFIVPAMGSHGGGTVPARWASCAATG